jgi:UTP--glucose-1-phosphate uridylyltransferase
VKTTNELLLLRSDIYELDEDSRVVSTIDHAEPFVDLSKHYKFVDGFEARFPRGVPSIREASSFVVDGDVTFGAGVVVRGEVRLHADSPTTVPDGAVLTGDG